MTAEPETERTTGQETEQEHGDALFGLVAESFDGMHMDRAPEGILARGSTLRRRRTALPAAVAMGAAAAIALAVVALPSSGAGSGTATATGRQSVNVDLAAWSVHTNANRSVTLTVRDIKDTDHLRTVLAQAGIPAYVLEIRATKPLTACTGEDGLPQIVQVLKPLRIPGTRQSSVTIDPSKMPKGSALEITVTSYDPPLKGGVTSSVGFQLIKDVRDHCVTQH